MKTVQLRYRPLVASALVGMTALLGGCGGSEPVTIEIPEGTAPPPSTTTGPSTGEDTGGG